MARKYSTAQFINAMPKTGGIISMIARKVGCDWHTANRYIEKHPTVRRAWEHERSRITDRAQHNIVKSIEGGDLQLSKWWLRVMDKDFRDNEAVILKVVYE